ncbi:DUF4352 domain-containing protein [Granulicoccus phenolivorans]|uniref:DUF4352 domain-containing protein n=1 Tax=Granulicoccus phenolivorans TaxID=266854 RepID=UPI0004228447|nr:DUF4352 domain-containing protein [Granulicoccus phenolivorans]
MSVPTQGPGQPMQGPGYPAGAPTQPPAKVKKPLWKRWWFWAIAVIVVIAIASPKGGNSTTASQPAESQAPQATATSGQEAPAEQAPAGLPGVGTPVAAGDLEITVNKVSTTTQLKSALGNKSGNWVVVDVTIKNNGQKQATITSSDLKLVEADGTEYSTDSDNIMYLDSEKNLFLKQINPKLSTDGQVLFATPEQAKDFTLKFNSGLFGPAVEIDLKS